MNTRFSVLGKLAARNLPVTKCDLEACPSSSCSDEDQLWHVGEPVGTLQPSAKSRCHMNMREQYNSTSGDLNGGGIYSLCNCCGRYLL